MENPENKEGARLKLSFDDFKAGHYLGVKEPPLGLNEVFRMNHPELTTRAREIFNRLSEGEEEVLDVAEIETDEGTEALDIKVAKIEGRPDIMYIDAYPRSKHYYNSGEDLES